MRAIPGFSREDLRSRFSAIISAVTNVLWLGNGIAGDDTHGHVDDLARFVDRSNRRHRRRERAFAMRITNRLRDNLARLRRMNDQKGQPLRIVTLPMPEPVYFDGQRLPASYANFYIANQIGAWCPPLTIRTIAPRSIRWPHLFPGRVVVGIACRDLVLGLGTLHCMTQQQPA